MSIQDFGSNATRHYPLWTKFIDRDPYWYTRKVKKDIHIRLCPDNMNTNSGIEIPEAWMPAIKVNNIITTRCHCRPLREQSLV